jgi:hypothetical protein
MPLSDRARTAVLTSLSAGVWTELSPVPTPQEHGFDHLDVTVICDFRGQAKTALEVMEMWPLGKRYGNKDFWLRNATPQRRGGHIWQVALHYEGRIRADKPTTARRLATNEIMQIDALDLGDAEVPANVREANPSIEIGYVQIGGTIPTALVGTAGTPAITTPVRSPSWATLAAQRINIPNGWVMTDVDIDTIAGSDPQAHFIRETWQYVFQFVPL